MATHPNPNILTEINDQNNMVSVENPPRRILLLLRSLWSLYEEHYPPGFLKKVVAEIISTFLLVFVTCGSAALSAASDQHKVSQLGASVAGGLVVTVMIYAVGHISGAHMNPAVTIAFAAIRHLSWKQVPLYATAQITGSIAASFTLREMLHPIERIGTTSPSGTDLQALIMEIVVTFSMMFITSAVATDPKARGELGGIAVGSAVCITSILAGPISGGSMNPAKSIGPAIASNYYKGIWVYVVGPLMGTLLGALSYNFVRDSENTLDEISSPRACPIKRYRLEINDHPGKLPNYRDTLDHL